MCQCCLPLHYLSHRDALWARVHGVLVRAKHAHEIARYHSATGFAKVHHHSPKNLIPRTCQMYVHPSTRFECRRYRTRGRHQSHPVEAMPGPSSPHRTSPERRVELMTSRSKNVGSLDARRETCACSTRCKPVSSEDTRGLAVHSDPPRSHGQEPGAARAPATSYLNTAFGER